MTTTATIDAANLSDDAIGVVPVTLEDGWETVGNYAEDWDYVQAPDCDACGTSARWNDDEHAWACATDGCENHGEEIDEYGDGPMMNYYYPLPSLGDAADEYDAADRIRDTPLCVVRSISGRESTLAGSDAEYALALTGGGMDLSWEICEAFVLLGFLPPAHFADLPGMSGRGESADDRAVIAACLRSLTEHAEQLHRRATGASYTAANLATRYGIEA